MLRHLLLVCCIVAVSVLASASFMDNELATQLSTNEMGFLEAVGRCRASCVDRFARGAMRLTENTCKERPDCFMCWENCEMMYKNWNIWGRMCENTVICFAGCESACAFYQQPPEASPETLDWKFSQSLHVKPHLRQGVVDVGWGHAKPSRVPLYPAAVVYAPFWHSARSDRWFPLPLTLGHHIKAEDGNMIMDMDGFMVFGLNRHDLLVAEYSKVSTVPTPAPVTPNAEFPIVDLLNMINITEEHKLEEFKAYTPQTNPLVLFALIVGSALVVASILSIGFITGVHILHARRRHRFRTGRNYAIRVHGRLGSVKACAGGDRSKSQSRNNLMKVGGGEDGAGSDWNVAHGYLNDGSHHTTMSASLHAHSFSGQKGGRAAYKPDLAPDAVYGGQNLDNYAVYAVSPDPIYIRGIIKTF